MEFIASFNFEVVFETLAFYVTFKFSVIDGQTKENQKEERPR